MVLELKVSLTEDLTHKKQEVNIMNKQEDRKTTKNNPALFLRKKASSITLGKNGIGTEGTHNRRSNAA